jgi:cell wall-associated NlpC family hydrolase
MTPIVIDVERPLRHSTPRSARSARLLRRVLMPVMTVVTVCSGTVLIASRPVVADTIAGAKAKAAQIEAQLASAQNEMSVLSQQYDAASLKLHTIESNIATTQATIVSDQKHVSDDRTTLSKAAVSNYVTDGSAATENPIFSNNQKTIGAATEYNQIVSGDINEAVANLHTAENTLNVEETQLQSQRGQAQSAVSAQQAAIAQNQAAENSQASALAQENGEIAHLVAQQQEAQAAAAVAAANQRLSAARATIHTASFNNQAAPPPTAAGGQGAVQAAESQEGVPYEWGAASPKGTSNPGFDCSGLTMWAWGQVGVGLPHYSGAQMGDSAPVPLSDLQPGDLLFYGPGGSDHVAMYVGGGEMVEAPHTGASVWVTGARFGDGFVGAGRP